MADPIIHWIEAQGVWAPWLFLALFLVTSFGMLWRLEAMSAQGFENTALGTLVMPYCSGLGNLIVAFILGRDGGSGSAMMTNALVNNVTDMTLVLGLPALIWGMSILPQQQKTSKGKTAKGKTSKGKKSKGAGKIHEMNRLSLLLTLAAVVFFTGAVWALGRKGTLTRDDSLILTGLFLFWQCFHVVEAMKTNLRQGKSPGWMLAIDLILLAVCAYGIYVSTEWLVTFIQNRHDGFISKQYIGWLTGWLTVLPNAVMAFYYGLRGQPETVYASQVGDCHVSIPLSLGVYTLFRPMTMPPFFYVSMWILLASASLHFLFLALYGRLPRYFGFVLVAAYVVFLWNGFLSSN